MSDNTPENAVPDDEITQAAETEREALLEQISDLLDKPMIGLSVAWMVLVVVDLMGYRHRFLEVLYYAIWIAFILHFLLELIIAPKKGRYLRRNWLTAVSFIVPAFRMLRTFHLIKMARAARAARSLELLRVVATTNRSLRAARVTLARRGVAYVLLINAAVLLLGAGGIFAFERPPEGRIGSYPQALWYTAMLLTTLGSDLWPQTAEGRILTWLLSLFAFSVFGYVTATLASLFIHQDAQDTEERQEERLHADMAALREEVRALRDALTTSPPNGPPPHRK